jgi:tetratricopeptide (TPR) repeat protein
MSSISVSDLEADYRRRLLEAGRSGAEEIISDILKVSATLGDDLLPIRIGIDLRDSNHDLLAIIVFESCLNYSCRASALYELGVIKAGRGEVEQSIYYLETRLREAGLQPYEKAFLARQYARQGRLVRAEALLDEAAALDPLLRHECLISSQSFKFFNRFDKRIAYGLLEEVKSIFNVYSSDSQVVERIKEALAKEEPFLLLRLGDGEGSIIRLSVEDDAEYNLLYRDNLEEFTDFWFNDRSIAYDRKFSEIIAEFNKVPFESDVIGTFHVAGIENEYALGSRRGIVWAINTLRTLLKIASVKPHAVSNMLVGDPLINYNMFASGALGHLLENCPRVGLISCHPGLAASLQEKYNIGEIEFIKIPAEKIHADIVGGDAAEGDHWPDRYHQVRSIIANKDRKGWLFLVAAGMLGKIYAMDLKKSGAVVLDIGSIADALVGKNTRIFPQAVKDRMPV